MNVVTVDKGTAEVGFAEHPNRDFARLTEKTGYGVVSGLDVAAQSTPNMTLNVGPGVIYLPSGDRYALLGATIAVNAANATNPRIDIVYVSSAGVISYLAGTAAASPTAPALSAGGVLLAEIAVAAGTSSITAANVTDKRRNMWAGEWIYPTLLNGWTGSFRYRKMLNGDVECEGAISGGAIGSHAVIFPTGYRPVRSTVQFATTANYAFGRLSVDTAGYLYITSGATTNVSLDVIRFAAA